ncbi:uncharacterized protein LAESUDRAFT_714276 [Laetiporus sulphureus 93-53]|uniref:Uncharacterized protein n=1 Tax=Laetiporus sulphureus 93-53 TaxID=1314785 RepID=A0A165E9R4_9APHY|nr:uncharacterized protein LAESUDRAFT_714276 [Laetiporus sulphureus 93-53]KZT06547.1 hypothetical protein LAESUDRAFT_714276 [Laetiporus sulphureus 93-53]
MADPANESHEYEWVTGYSFSDGTVILLLGIHTLLVNKVKFSEEWELLQALVTIIFNFDNTIEGQPFIRLDDTHEFFELAMLERLTFRYRMHTAHKFMKDRVLTCFSPNPKKGRIIKILPLTFYLISQTMPDILYESAIALASWCKAVVSNVFGIGPEPGVGCNTHKICETHWAKLATNSPPPLDKLEVIDIFLLLLYFDTFTCAQHPMLCIKCAQVMHRHCKEEHHQIWLGLLKLQGLSEKDRKAWLLTLSDDF